jgi:hypothetical protein
VTDESLLARVPPGTEVIRVRGGSALSAWLGLMRGAAGRRSTRTFAGLRRLSDWWLMPDSYAGWSRRARAAAERRAQGGGFDAMLSSSPPDSVHLAALAVHRRTGLPWVADFRDPWVGLHSQPPSRWHRAPRRPRARVLEGADVVLAASRHARRSTGPLAGAAQRDPSAQRFRAEKGAALLARRVRSRALRAVFSGTLAQMPDAEVFLEALRRFAHRPEARRRVRVAGPTKQATRIARSRRPQGTWVHGTAPSRRARPPARGRHTPLEAAELSHHGAGQALRVPRRRAADSRCLPETDRGADARAGGEIVAPGDRSAWPRALERRHTEWRGRRPPARAPLAGRHTRDGSPRASRVLDDLAGGSK